MKTSVAEYLAGGPAALARILGITVGAVCQWGETMPKLREYQLRELRPEWFVDRDKVKPRAVVTTD